MHDFALVPPVEHAPDQIASRPSETERVTDVPSENDADCELPVATFMPAGAELTVSPVRPDAATVNVAFCAAGFIVKEAVCRMPPAAAVTVAVAGVSVMVVDIANVADVAPCATVTLAGTVASGLLLDSATTKPPTGAAPFNVIVPVRPIRQLLRRDLR